MSKAGEVPKKLTITIQLDGQGGLTLVFVGSIIDGSEFPVLDLKNVKVIYFDLGGVRALNSVGIRDLINWRKKIPTQLPIVFRQCASQVIDQMNILDGFAPINSVVESFFVPYICESCDFPQLVLFRQGTEYEHATADHPEKIVEPTVNCPQCGKPMTMDMLPDKYFRFLKRH